MYMLRHAPRMLLGRALGSSRVRSMSDLPVAPVADSAFVEGWKKVIPNMEPPKTPLSFMHPRPPTPSSIPSKISVNFVLPYQSELSTKQNPHGVEMSPLVLMLTRKAPDIQMHGHPCSFRISKTTHLLFSSDEF